MNDKGKFKKATIIVMLVAVFISVCSLAWVLIFQGDDAYQNSNEDFYNETAPIYTKAANADSAEEDDNSPDVKVTVPYSYALDTVNMDSQLTEEQKQLGFKSVVYDGQDSLTYTLSESKYRTFLRTFRFDITSDIDDALHRTYPAYRELDFNDELTRFTVRVDRTEYVTAEGSEIAAIISPVSATYRYYAQLNASCTIVIEDIATGEAIATITA